MPLRSAPEVDAEYGALEAFIAPPKGGPEKFRIPVRNNAGGNNHECIENQLLALRFGWNEQKARDWCNGSPPEELAAANDAVAWLNGQTDEAPSAKWLRLYPTAP